MPSALFIIADDVAKADFDEFLPFMPHMQSLVDQGVYFSRGYSMPVCGQSRFSIHTGEWGRRYGMINDIGAPELGLPPGATTIGQMANSLGASTGLFGKWHLGGEVLTGALDHGYDVWRAGTYLNLNDPDRGSSNYTSWFRIDDGSGLQATQYATTAQGQTFVGWWNATAGDKVAVLSLNAPHGPLHRPPPIALPPGYVPPKQANARLKFKEMCLSLDVLLGYVIASCSSINDALMVFCGDNGTSDNNLPFPLLPGRAKETPYERGIRVPLVMRPPGGTAQGTVDTGLRHISDVWATISDHFESVTVHQDSLSLYGPGHDYVISEATLADTSYKVAVARDDGWKLVFNGAPPQQFFFLPDDPDELNPIPPSTIPTVVDELRELLESG